MPISTAQLVPDVVRRSASSQEPFFRLSCPRRGQAERKLAFFSEVVGGEKAVADKQAAEANAMKEDVEADLAEVHSIINYIYQMITLAVR